MTSMRERKPKSAVPMRLQLAEPVGHSTRELAQRLHRSNTARQFGIRLEEAEPGRAVLSMRVQKKHLQVHGVVHGGILAVLADTAAGMAVYCSISRGTRIATVEMKINYLETVDGGNLLAEAKVLRVGRNFAVAECDVRDSHGRLAAKALLTFAVGVSEAQRR